MFAPLGFISLDEVEAELCYFAEEWRLSTPHEDDPLRCAVYDPESDSTVDLQINREIAFREWLFQCFLNRHERNLYACTQEGRPLKVSEFITRRVNLYDGIFEDNVKSWSDLIEHLSRGVFYYINPRGFIIDIDFCRSEWGDDIADEFASVARFLDKCPICWPLPDNKPVEDWREVCGISRLQELPKMDGSPEGLKRRILETWYADRSLTKGVLKERIAPTLSFRKFNFGWQLAVLECEELSRPGRRGG